MRSTRSLAGALVLLVGLGVGCDSDTPLQREEQKLAVVFVASGAQLTTFNAWDLIVDNDFDGLPDSTCAGDTSILCSNRRPVIDCGANGPCISQVFLWCEDNNNITNINPSSMPWNYSLEVSIIRAKSTTREVLIPGIEGNVLNNMAPYNTATNATIPQDKADLRVLSCAGGVDDGIVCTSDADCTAGICTKPRRFVFSNPRTVSPADRDVVEADRNPLFDFYGGLPPFDTCAGGTDDGIICTGDADCPFGGICTDSAPGLCFPSVDFPGLPRVAIPDEPPEGFPLLSAKGSGFTAGLQKGDTLFVKARISDFTISGFAGVIVAEPTLQASLFVDGAQVQVDGSTLSNSTSGTGISFSFTSR